MPQGIKSLSMLVLGGPIYVRDCTDEVVHRNEHFLQSTENDLKPLPKPITH